MKNHLFIIPLLALPLALSLSSCTSKSEDNGLPISTTTTSEPTTTSSVESTIPQTESDGSVEQNTVATKAIEETEGEVTPYASIEDIPKEIYDPDSELSVTEQLAKLEESYEKGLITDEQLDIIADQLFNKGNSGGSTSGSTEANGDTYIPAHGNPGTVMSNEDTGKTNDHTQADMSWAIGATID